MALPVVVVQESITDKFVGILVKLAKNLKIALAYDKTSELGPVVTDSHRQSVINWITSFNSASKLDSKNKPEKRF